MTITQHLLSDLHLTGATGDLSPHQLAWLPSLPSTASDSQLRHELETKGVVHVKGVMPREFVLAARRQYFTHMAPSGILKDGTDPSEGRWRGGQADGNDYVNPSSAGLVKISEKAKENLKLGWEVPKQAWAAEFCGNECESLRRRPSLRPPPIQTYSPTPPSL